MNNSISQTLPQVFLPPYPSNSSIVVTLDSEGTVSHVTFAITDIVYILDASSGCTTAPSTSASGVFPLDNLFKQLLAGKDGRSVFLAGFDMPRLALRLFFHFGYHVKGTDLSTVCSPSYTEAWLPGKVAAAKIGGSMDTFRINRLWHENSDSEENLCLRAWLSASIPLGADADAFLCPFRLAQVCRTGEIKSVKKVDTRNVRKDILKCLGELLKQTDILSRSLPKETVSEYDHFDLKGGDDGFKLTNARYKVRVGRSQQFMG
ncbi:hypothetical protein D9758_009796 [Tetrapyrgos nigripes]|uniref:Uncharacterized protein n=1 Tax=Tetrapyrgos nigripes TaxID=182062 RepID=A0A8H5LR40_9AGAR|nr:hypothetical protein D9758_009796 [Tetrapyrgos nigripes]